MSFVDIIMLLLEPFVVVINDMLLLLEFVFCWLLCDVNVCLLFDVNVCLLFDVVDVALFCLMLMFLICLMLFPFLVWCFWCCFFVVWWWCYFMLLMLFIQLALVFNCHMAYLSNAIEHGFYVLCFYVCHKWVLYKTLCRFLFIEGQ